MPEPHIRVEGLSKVYRSGGADLVVFSGVDLEIARGEMLALVGESGAGKSTLLHLMGGLDRPSSGTIYYASTEISSLSDSAQADFRNREIGFVWQIHYLLPEFTAQENVMMPLLIRGCPRPQAASESLARLDEVGLRARSTHRAGELSGGEQQRVELAHPPELRVEKKRGPRTPAYDSPVRVALIRAWEMFDFPCGQRLGGRARAGGGGVGGRQ